MSSADNARAVALELLRRWDAAREFADETLHKALARSRLSPVDRKLLVELFYGVIRWRALLDWVIRERCPEKPPSSEAANLLRVGVYQILLLDRIPEYAAVNETVNLATGGRRRFVNALLRRVAREKSKIQLAWKLLEAADPATAFSHPRFLVDRWLARHGRDRTIALLKWNNQPPPVYARVNTLRTNAEALRSQLRAEGVVVRECGSHSLCLEIEAPASIESLPSFQAGLFYVQDPSTLLAVDALDPQPGETILDACAAPGGKTTYIAQKMQNRGRIVATDTSETRLERVVENSKRLGVSIVCPQSSVLSPQSSFDRILVDAPCSNTGVIRRRVDLRWRIRESEISRLARTQRDILHQVAPLLKRGGQLVYSTCSLEPEENEQLVGAFLADHSEFQQTTSKLVWPTESNTDGAFIAMLTKS